MEDMTLCSPEHREVFERVWQRVMDGRSPEGSPVVVTSADVALRDVTGDMSCDHLTALAQQAAQETRQTAREGQQTGRNQPAQPLDRQGSDLRDAEEAAPCECTAQLRQQIMDALEGWQFYRHMARRTRGTSSRTLTGLAADHHRHARRLSAAYFLLTGLRYWPSEQLATPTIPSFWGALRQRHQMEQQMELSYTIAAEESADPTLPELYQELAAGCRDHCRQLRALLEQSCP